MFSPAIARTAGTPGSCGPSEPRGRELVAAELRCAGAAAAGVRGPLRRTVDAVKPPDQLRAQLKIAQARVFELEETLTDSREELEAVREINREMLAGQNRSSR